MSDGKRMGIIIFVLCAIGAIICYKTAVHYEEMKELQDSATECRVVIDNNNYYAIEIYSHHKWTRIFSADREDYAISQCNDLMYKNNNRNKAVYSIKGN